MGSKSLDTRPRGDELHQEENRQSMRGESDSTRRHFGTHGNQ